MTVGAIAALFEERRAGTNITTAEVCRWISDLDGRVAELMCGYCPNAGEDASRWENFGGYAFERDSRREVLAPDEYAGMYEAYFTYRADLVFEEYARAANSAVIFNNMFDEFSRNWHRTHRIKGASYIKI